MSDEKTDRKTDGLGTELEPPPGLEDRVVNELIARQLIIDASGSRDRGPGRGMVRVSLAAAACIALVGVGVLLGRASSGTTIAPLTALDGAGTDLYALVLLETDSYARPEGNEYAQRFGEYSRWIAKTAQSGHFVAGEDFEDGGGLVLSATTRGIESVSPDERVMGKPLGGILFIRANDYQDAVKITRDIPHLVHGGAVLIQKTLPTNVPPG